MQRIFARVRVGLTAVVCSAVFAAAAQAQVIQQFQFQGGAPRGFNASGNQGGHPAMNNMGAFGGFGNFSNRFDFRQGNPTINTPPVAVNATLNGRNTTIYSNVNPSAYLGGVGKGQSGQVGQFGQNGQFGQFGNTQNGGFTQPGVIFGQPTGGQFGQFGQPGTMGQFGQIGGVGGKPGANGFNQIGGGGQFGSRYGL